MRSTANILFLLIFSLLCFFSVANAAGIGSQFAGVILRTKSAKIEALENANFACSVPGTTIQIRSKGVKGYQPTEYIIPTGLISKTKKTVKANQLIMGRYSGKVSITCVYQGVPPVEETVQLDKITLFGNSAF